ncbi:MAG: class I SAM-dependent methyltransferase [Candidatus Hodarchaeota archaeon]
MNNVQIILLLIVAIIIIIFLILALPRKINERVSSIEGLDDHKVAKAFERMNKTPPFKLLRKRVISELKKFNPTGVILDLGCGTGNLIIKIAKTFSEIEIIGVDISTEILDIARENVEKKVRNQNVKFKVGSAEDLPFPDESIDLIISSLSLHHWLNPSRALKEIYRVLNKKGTCIIFDFRRNSRKFFYGLLKFATKIVVPKPLKRINEPFSSLLASYTAKEVIQMVDQTPFKKVEISPFLAWMFLELRKS